MNTSFSNLIRELRKAWILFRPAIGMFVSLALFLAAVTIFLIIIYPDWLRTEWVLLLVIPAFVTILGVVNNILQIFEKAFDSIKLTQKIHNACRRVTNNALGVLKPKPRGIPEIIVREETEPIFDLVKKNGAVLFTGEAGVGKSGIACALVSDVDTKGFFPLLIDARRLAGIVNPYGLRSFFDLDEPVVDAVRRISEDMPVFIVADQIDNIAGTQSCKVLTDFLADSLDIENVYVVAISRYKEANEKGAIRPLLDAGFVMFTCSSVGEELTRHVLAQLGLQEIPSSLFDLVDNLLNLDIICEIIRTSASLNIDDIQNKIDLWERYRTTLIEREDCDNNNGHDFISEAVRLARIGLMSADRGFEIDIPPTQIQIRLSSGNIISQISGRKYQFRHDVLQDYLYAWFACERNFMPKDVRNEIGDLHERNTILWMRDIYQQKNVAEYESFLEDALDG